MAGNDDLEQLYRAHAPDLMSFAYALLHSWDAAEDVVHDVFLQISQRRSSIDTSKNIRGYLYTAAYNSALNRLKQERRNVDDWEESFAQLTSGAPLTDDQLITDENTRRIRRAVASLPERMRQVAILRWQHDLSRAEIANILGTSEKTVANQLQRAKELLKAALGVTK